MEFSDSIFYYVKIIDLKQKIQYNGKRITKMKKLCTIWFKIKGRLKMTIKEREMILNLTYLELAEKFRNEPQVLIKFLREEQKKWQT